MGKDGFGVARVAAAVLVAALALIAAPRADAGTYVVYACTTADGTFANHSWATSAGPGFAQGNCGRDPAVFVSAAANLLFDAGDSASVTFSAPPDATIAHFWMHRRLYQFNPLDGAPTGRQMLYTLVQVGDRAMELEGSYDPQIEAKLASHGAWYQSGAAADTDSDVTDASYVELAGYKGDARTIRLTAGCWTSPCALMTDGLNRAGQSTAYLYGAEVTISDSTVPDMGGIEPTGLNGGGLVAGDEPLTFAATDNSGIAKAELVDVTPGADSKVLATTVSKCDYTYATPCPQLSGAQLSPQGISPGLRLLVVRLTDAAGNATVSAPVSVDVGGALNGSPASPAAKLRGAFARNKKTRLTVDYGKRATIKGQLTDAADHPIADATVELGSRNLVTGAHYALAARITTGPDGRFQTLLPAGPARAIQLEYRYRVQATTVAARATLQLRVRAGVTLHITPRATRPGGTIRLSGRLRGTPLPPSGKIVDLQAYDAGRWRTFDTVRTHAKGAFAARYRFVRTAPGHSFRFRARVRRDDSYPYYLGYSHRVGVRVR